MKKDEMGRVVVADLVGQRFGMRTVVAQAPRELWRRAAEWVCECDCGGFSIVTSSNLRGSKSCGCWRRKSVRDRTLTHGQSRARHGAATPTYVSWQAMKNRCFNANADNFDDYGGRGITVCDEWRESFEAFRADMGERPSRTSIDRIDPDGDYEPDNCRWATQSVQNSNQRKRKVGLTRRRSVSR